MYGTFHCLAQDGGGPISELTSLEHDFGAQTNHPCHLSITRYSVFGIYECHILSHYISKFGDILQISSGGSF